MKKSNPTTMTPEQAAQARIDAYLRKQADYEARNAKMLAAKRRAEDNIHSQYVRLQAAKQLQTLRNRKFETLLRD